MNSLIKLELSAEEATLMISMIVADIEIMKIESCKKNPFLLAYKKILKNAIKSAYSIYNKLIKSAELDQHDKKTLDKIIKIIRIIKTQEFSRWKKY